VASKSDKIVKVNVDELLRMYADQRINIMKWICTQGAGTPDQIIRAVSDIRAISSVMDNLEKLKDGGTYTKNY